MRYDHVRMRFVHGGPGSGRYPAGSGEKSKGLIRRMEYDKIAGNITTLNFSKEEEELAALSAINSVHLQVVNDFDVVQKVVSKYPVADLKVVDGRNIAPKIVQDPNSSHNTASGLYDQKYRSITVSRGNGSKEWADAAPRIGDTNVGLNGPGIYRHELGHHVYDYLGATFGQEAFVIKSQFSAAVKGMSDREIQRGISGYALVKDMKGNIKSTEAFAEAFSAWTNPKYGSGKRLDRRIETVFENHFKRKL